MTQAEYSFDAGDWQIIDPVGKISDSRTETYDFVAPVPVATSQGKAAGPDPTEHTVVVRAYDRFGNMGSGKAVVSAGAPQ